MDMPSRARGTLRHLVELPAMRRPPREVRGRQLHCRRDRDRQGGAWSRSLRPFSRRRVVVDFFFGYSDSGRGMALGLIRRRRCERRGGSTPPRSQSHGHCSRFGPRSPIWICPRAREGRSATWSSCRRCGDRRARYGVDNFTAAAIATGKGVLGLARSGLSAGAAWWSISFSVIRIRGEGWLSG